MNFWKSAALIMPIPCFLLGLWWESDRNLDSAAYNYVAKGNPSEAIAWAKRMATPEHPKRGIKGLRDALKRFPEKAALLNPESAKLLDN